MANIKLSTLVKLGSIIVHLEEYAETGEPLDLDSAQTLMADPEVLETMGTLRAQALLPLKRADKGQ